MGLADQVPADWWRTFFSPDYCVIYRHEFAPGRTADEVRMVEKAVPLRTSHRILDLCCGHARHMHMLREKGYSIIGIDLSRDQLDVARSRQETFEITLSVARADVRMLPLASSFDVVISMNGSFGYLSEAGNERHLAEAARVLRSGGAWVLDQQNPALLSQLPPRREVRDPETGTSVVEEFEIDHAARRIHARKLLRFGEDVREYFFSIRVYSLEEVRALLARLGLDVVRTFGDYDLSSYRSDSDRMIVVAVKP